MPVDFVKFRALKQQLIRHVKQIKVSPTDVTKKCTSCKRILPVPYFASAHTGRMCTGCLPCRLTSVVSQSRPGSWLQQLRKLTDEERAKPCVGCGVIDPIKAQFDHVDPTLKRKHINQCRNIDEYKLEMENVQILCVVCHARKTEASRKRSRPKSPNASYIDALKHDIGGCQNCGQRIGNIPLRVFEFDHVDPGLKKHSISALRNGAAREIVDTELAKCRLLCYACHRKRTLVQKQLVRDTICDTVLKLISGHSFGL